jgi:hypothetical protein
VRRNALWILLVALVGAMAWSVARRGRHAVPYSTWSTGRDGTRALFRLLAETGRRPERWTQDLGRLPDGGMLVALGDGEPQRPLGRRERDRLRDWLEAGGTLVVLGARGYAPRGASFSIEPAPEPETKDPDAGEPEEPTPRKISIAGLALARGLTDVAIRAPGEIKVDAPGWELLLGDLKAPVGVVVPVGLGHVVAVAGSSFVTNRDVGAGDHAPLFARVVERFAPEGPVRFDEFHLGMGSGRSIVSWLRGAGFGPAIAQALLVVCLLLTPVAVRFGAASPPPPPPPDDTRTYVEGMGRIYGRAGDVVACADRLVGGVLARVAARHGLEAQAGPRALADALRAGGREAAADAVEAMESARARLVAGAKPRPADLVSLGRELDRLLGQSERRAA